MFFMDYIFNGTRRDIFNGYTTQSISKLKNIILFYIERYNGVFFTMMNKLLFYTEDLFTAHLLHLGVSGTSHDAAPHYTLL